MALASSSKLLKPETFNSTTPKTIQSSTTLIVILRYSYSNNQCLGSTINFHLVVTGGSRKVAVVYI